MNPGGGGEGWASLESKSHWTKQQAELKKKSEYKEMGHKKKGGKSGEMNIPKDGIWVLENTRKRAETLEKMRKVYIQRKY